MSRQSHKITNDYYTLSAEFKETILVEVMKRFIKHKKKIPQRLLSDLKKAREENKKRILFTLHTDVKTTKDMINVYYKQYKHLNKYYPKDLDYSTHWSLQRGERAVDISKKFEILIRLKADNKIWRYNDDVDNVMWVDEGLFKDLKTILKTGEIKKDNITKEDIHIGGVKWYAIKMGCEKSKYNWGIMSLANEFMAQGEYFVFNNESNRNNYYDWVLA